ncbi:MAG: GGDEF domain-containing protein [Pseudomonadota bacterium]
MTADETFASDGTRHVVDAWMFFFMTTATALALAAIVSIIASQTLGVPQSPAGLLSTNLVVAACVAIPMAAIAAQHDYKLHRYQRELEAMASTDPLTGLLNRRSFKKAAREELARMPRTQQTATVALFDLDHFKALNDKYGHNFGDVVLARIAEIAHSELRGPFDKLGRWGGEEFVILLSDVTKAQADSVCERLRARIEASTIRQGRLEAGVTASFGLAGLTPENELESAIEQADAALYEAKRLGRNRIVSYAAANLVSAA